MFGGDFREECVAEEGAERGCGVSFKAREAQASDVA